MICFSDARNACQITVLVVKYLCQTIRSRLGLLMNETQINIDQVPSLNRNFSILYLSGLGNALKSISLYIAI